jgi:hypothetical protein
VGSLRRVELYVRGIWRLFASSSRGDGDVSLCSELSAEDYWAKGSGVAVARTTKDTAAARSSKVNPRLCTGEVGHPRYCDSMCELQIDDHEQPHRDTGIRIQLGEVSMRARVTPQSMHGGFTACPYGAEIKLLNGALLPRQGEA